MMERACILIVGGARSGQNAMTGMLASEAMFRTWYAPTAHEALALIQASSIPFAAVILDTPWSDSDAATLFARLRQRRPWTAIIVVSESYNEQDVVSALNAGAIDFLIRPVRAIEFVARLRAHIRRQASSGTAVVMIGPYHFYPADRALLDPLTNRRVRLTLKEAGLLKCLYRAAGEPVSRDALLHTVWHYRTDIQTHTIESHIYRLRRKIEPDPSAPTIVVSVPGGYCLGRQDSAAHELPAPMDRLPAGWAAARISSGESRYNAWAW